uniref:Uncharacterized protein n=1 Tax=Anguilla anguilla TaxID=7936 RepID=A0A0E9T0Y8_ANGAN
MQLFLGHRFTPVICLCPRWLERSSKRAVIGGRKKETQGCDWPGSSPLRYISPSFYG